MKYIYLPLSFCLLFLASNAQQWQWVSPFPQGNDLYASQLFDDGTAYIGGAAGTMMKSIDFGASWSEIEYNFPNDVRSLSFINSDTGYVLTVSYDSSCLYKTTNGGQNWERTFVMPMWLNVVWFMNDTTGFIGGEWGLILRTSEGGNTWIEVPYSETYSYVRFSALSPQIIYASELNGAIIKSVDGGLTWNEVISGIGYSPFLHHFDDQTGIYAGAFDSKIYKTYDGGSTWWPKSEENVYATFMSFFDEANGIVSSRNGDIRHTADQGETWQLFPSTIPSSFFRTASFTSMQQGIMGGEGGQLAITDNGGLSLTQISSTITNQDLKGIFFLNDSTGFVGSDHGKIFKTTNRWITCDTLFIPFDAHVEKIDFPTALTGYALAWWEEDFRVYKTTDGGEIWQNMLTGELPDMKFFDENTGIVTSINGILSTHDGGENWLLFPTLSEFTLKMMSFADANTGYVAGTNNQNQGIIYKTTNGGQDWQVVTNEPPGLIALKAITADTVYAATQLGWFYQSFDGGVTWSSDDNFTEAGLIYVHLMDFYDPNRGVCTGSIGSANVIAETVDGGTNWIIKKITQKNPGSDICLIPESATWYITGKFGTMLRKTDTTIVAGKNISLPREILTVNPNPASDEITIGLPGHIIFNPVITIFNSQGRCVYSAKHSNPKINISHLKPGVYFLRVSSGKDVGGGVLVVQE